MSAIPPRTLADHDQQMYAVNQRGPDPGPGDPQGYRHEEADADAEGEREDFGP
jgi:nuclear transcription factor Y gamma